MHVSRYTLSTSSSIPGDPLPTGKPRGLQGGICEYSVRRAARLETNRRVMRQDVIRQPEKPNCAQFPIGGYNVQ
jgi:hypothetical protein